MVSVDAVALGAALGLLVLGGCFDAAHEREAPSSTQTGGTSAATSGTSGGGTPSGATSATDGCHDHALDGTETDVDCGGSCAPCPTGSRCATGSDCASGRCESAVCMDGSATTGSPCAGACSAGQTCSNGQCVSLATDAGPCGGACGSNQACIDGHCVTNVPDAGPCANACAADQSCVNGQCVSPVQDAGACGACPQDTNCQGVTCVPNPPDAGPTTCDPCASSESCVNGLCVGQLQDGGFRLPEGTVWHQVEYSNNTYTGTWTWHTDHFDATWVPNGSIAVIRVLWFDSRIVLDRRDPSGITTGMSANYTGAAQGRGASGTEQWGWGSPSVAATWTATW